MKQTLRVFLLVAALSLSMMTQSYAMITDEQAQPRKQTVEAVPGEYIVKLKENTLVGAAALTSNMTLLGLSLGGQIKTRFEGDPTLFVVKKSPGFSAQASLKELAGNEMVEYAEPNYIYRIQALPNDPDLVKTWGVRNVGQKDKDTTSGNDPFPPQEGIPGVDVNAEKAWGITTGSKDIVVAVIDTGIDYTHPELKENLWVNEAEAKGKPKVDDDGNGFVDDIYGYNFVKNNGDPKDGHAHGTHVAGSIGATGNDGKGIVGVAWQVRLMALKFLGDDGSGTLEAAIKSIDYATLMGAKVMSNSWGGGGFSQALKDAIDRAAKKKILFVAAAGNSSENNDVSDNYPSNYTSENVLAVAAMDNQGALASFSNYGKKTVHVGAPGVNVYSTIPTYKNATGKKNHAHFSGTSMATPHVSGVAALMLAHENLNAVDVKNRIISTSARMETLAKKTVAGGRVDAYAAIMNTPPPPDPNDPNNWANKENYALSTEHPYALNKTVKFTVTKPGASRISVHFSRFETEAKYDKVSFQDAQGNPFGEPYEGTHDGEWSPPVDGDTVVLTLTSDDTANLYGFDIDQIAWE